MKKTSEWYTRAKQEADKGVPTSERIFGIIIVTISILLITYFALHQIKTTGFFTKSFGTFEMFFLYGYFIFWIISAGLEGIFKNRFLSRIIDAFGGIVFSGICILFLFVIFPFDFSYFANILPISLRFILRWISNDIAKVILVLIFIFHIVAAIYSPIAYKIVDKNIFKYRKSSET